MESALTTTGPREAAQLARQKIYAGIPDDDVKLALAICGKYGLDPLLRHLVLIESNKKDKSGNWYKVYNVYVTRDGLLHIAHESGVHFAITFDEPVRKDNPYSGESDIYLSGTLKREGHPDFVAGLWFSEYCNTKRDGSAQGAWATHPAAMHQKAVEVYLLRRGFDVSLPAMEEVQPDGKEIEPEPAAQIQAQVESQWTSENLDDWPDGMWSHLRHLAVVELGYDHEIHVKNTLKKIFNGDAGNITYAGAWNALREHQQAKEVEL